ncbi:hypothetical protein [Actinopolymorpha pittospori]|uniref:Uncharacterized protein n=1 Tax=Actinopolymorpha pittospori TaxID=648752 RepID=A0A927R6W6_9ACTN|nr:hypothetical protein [Actinopolymorpha pittospori]MBE1603574.1 hypothetical protein [Actinopolymorpha pittospori]
MAANGVSRRSVLGTGLGLGVAAAVSGMDLRNATAAEAAEQSTAYRPVSMAMHVHACFSEGGSWADGGGGASMMAQLDQATTNNVDVIWWTDHDWRMEAYGYYDGIGFDGTDEDGGLQWFEQNQGTVTGTQHAFVDEPHSPDEPGKAMRVTATGPAPDWGVSYLWGKPGNSFYSTNLSDTTLMIDVLGERIGPDAELVVQLETSNRPATAGRPAGLYVLEYRVGAKAARGLEKPLTGVVTVAATGGWQTLTIRPLEDIRAFWPDLLAEDTGLARLRFGVRARNNATAQAVFDHLRIDRTRDPLRWPVRTQREIMHSLTKQYPNVTQHMSTEVSMVRHLNVFMKDFELYPYPPTGKAPTLDNSVEGIEKVVRWYHERGALVQYNHPPTNAAAVAELVQTRALGTDLMEVANAGGDYDVIHSRLNMYDVAARNAIFLTATSQNDDHVGRNWLGMSHLFGTSVWAASTEVRDLMAALASGQAWLYDLKLWPTGQLDLAVGGQRAMGRVIRTAAGSVPVDLTAENLPAGSTVQIIVGVCDRTGQTSPSLEKHPYPADAFTQGRLPFRLDRENGRYLRVEVYNSADVLIGLGNPLWVLPPGGGIHIPAARGFAYRPHDRDRP